MKYKQSNMNKSPSMHTLFYYCKVELHVSAGSCSHKAILKPMKRKIYKTICLIDEIKIVLERDYTH